MFYKFTTENVDL